jgi:outer membrane phospholipase A
LWNIGEESAPFYDSSYRPEAWWHQEGLPLMFGMSGLDLQSGFGHESNGKAGLESRSLNKLFVRPVARWDLGDEWRLRLRPRVFVYAGDMSDNPDMADYRGYVDIDGDIGQRRDWLLNTQIRVGRGWNHASVLAELSYPLNRISNDWVNAFGFVQVYDGWSEMLRSYDERTTRLSVGIAIAR